MTCFVWFITGLFSVCFLVTPSNSCSRGSSASIAVTTSRPYTADSIFGIHPQDKTTNPRRYEYEFFYSAFRLIDSKRGGNRTREFNQRAWDPNNNGTIEWGKIVYLNITDGGYSKALDVVFRDLNNLKSTVPRKVATVMETAKLVLSYRGNQTKDSVYEQWERHIQGYNQDSYVIPDQDYYYDQA